ncbi:uncharacterized protein ACIBXB_007851, partial [Morphnus guianensis]
PGSDDRFARQDRYGPPPEFPLASPCPGIVHHLSGPSTDAHAPPPRPGGAGETGRWCARGFSLNAPRDPTSAGARRPSPSLRRGLSGRPLTRARARLLGPCFKTGRVGSRHRRGPRAPGRGHARPGGAARSGRTERSPPRLTAAPGAGGPGPPRVPRAGRPRTARGEGAAAVLSLGPGIRRDLLPGGCNTRRRSRGAGPPAHRRPSQPTRSRSRRTTAEEMRPARAGHRPGGGPRAGPPPPARPRGRVPGGRRGGGGGDPPDPRRPTATRRVESSGRTARAPPVYLLTVSRPLELSLQSSFQLSLTVLVGYRSRASI